MGPSLVLNLNEALIAVFIVANGTLFSNLKLVWVRLITIISSRYISDLLFIAFRIWTLFLLLYRNWHLMNSTAAVHLHDFWLTFMLSNWWLNCAGLFVFSMSSYILAAITILRILELYQHLDLQFLDDVLFKDDSPVTFELIFIFRDSLMLCVLNTFLFFLTFMITIRRSLNSFVFIVHRKLVDRVI